MSHSEILQEMNLMKTAYENKINHVMQKINDKDKSMRISYDLRKSAVFQDSPIKELNNEFIITDSCILKENNKNLTPSSGRFLHSRKNSANTHPNPMTESTVIDSVRSSLNFNHKTPENVELLEWKKCNAILTPSGWNVTANSQYEETPLRKKGNHQSFSENKASFANGKYPSSGDYSYLVNVRKSCPNDNSELKMKTINKSNSCDDCSSMDFNFQKNKEEYKKGENNLKKEKSITDRLDNTEALLKKINKKFDVIFKDGPKINIDIGKFRKSKKKGEQIKEKGSSSSKIKYNDKVKHIIQKIIMSRSEGKHNTTSSCKSSESSEASSATFQLTSNKGTNRFSNSRYKRI